MDPGARSTTLVFEPLLLRLLCLALPYPLTSIDINDGLCTLNPRATHTILSETLSLNENTWATSHSDTASYFYLSAELETARHFFLYSTTTAPLTTTLFLQKSPFNWSPSGFDNLTSRVQAHPYQISQSDKQYVPTAEYCIKSRHANCRVLYQKYADYISCAALAPNSHIFKTILSNAMNIQKLLRHPMTRNIRIYSEYIKTIDLSDEHSATIEWYCLIFSNYEHSVPIEIRLPFLFRISLNSRPYLRLDPILYSVLAWTLDPVVYSELESLSLVSNPGYNPGSRAQTPASSAPIPATMSTEPSSLSRRLRSCEQTTRKR